MQESHSKGRGIVRGGGSRPNDSLVYKFDIHMCFSVKYIKIAIVKL